MNAARALIPTFFTIQQVAAFLQVSVKTVRRQISAGALRTHRVGRQHRIADEDLLTFTATHRR